MRKMKFCIICGNTDFKDLYTSKDRMFDIKGLFFIKKCRTCAFVFIDPQPNKKELKKYYPSKNYYSYKVESKKGLFAKTREYLIRNYYHPTILSSILALLVNNVPAIPQYVKNGKILDLGCGAGDTLLLLKELGWQTYGIDMDKNAIANARKRGLEHISLGTYKKLANYPDRYFDAIRLYHVIEHIDDPSDCLRLMYKKIKKNGEIIIGTPNIASFAGSFFGSRWYNLDSPRHLFLFSPKNLKKLLQKHRFVLEKTEFCSGGGIIGSIQYYMTDVYKRKIDYIHNMWLVLLLYPFEKLLDLIKYGDVFVQRAKVK